MGLHRAAAVLGILGASRIAAHGVDRPQLACVKAPHLRWDGTWTHPCMTVADGVALCCEYSKYFALGSYNAEYGHHNRVMCANDTKLFLGEGDKNKIGDHLCDVGCPGRGKTFDPELNGLCGGGCLGCNTMKYGALCSGDKTVKCGSYQSVYSCNKNALSLRPTESPPHPTPRAVGQAPPLQEQVEAIQGGLAAASETVLHAAHRAVVSSASSEAAT